MERRRFPVLLKRRLVVFIGPPKTASTTLQSFLAKYASNDRPESKATAFDTWNYPLLNGKDDGGLKDLVLEFEKKESTRKEQLLRQPKNVNLVLGTEYLIFLHNHTRVLESLQRWTNTTPEIAIVYRSPRVSHFVSIWKQQTQVWHKEFYQYSFREWMCRPESQLKVLERLDVVANPLGVAYTSLRYWPTILVDTSGFLPGQDISHVFGCDVLNVPCHGRWIQGLEEKVIHKNTKKADPNLTRAEQSALEQIFFERDCAFFKELHNHSRLTIVHPNSLWKDHCQGRDGNYKFRQNSTSMLEVMRSIIGCGMEPLDTIANTASSTPPSSTNYTMKDTISVGDNITNNAMYLPDNKTVIAGDIRFGRIFQEVEFAAFLVVVLLAFGYFYGYYHRFRP